MSITANPTSTQILTSVIHGFLTNSVCATEKQQKEFLIKILGNKLLVTVLLFRGSQHGWKS